MGIGERRDAVVKEQLESDKFGLGVAGLWDCPAPDTSGSPSPSTSAADTEDASRKLASMVCSVQAVPLPAVFSHHTMSSASKAAPSTSRSPSPSMSAATERAPSKLESTARSVQAVRSPAVFSPHAMYSDSALTFK